MVCVPDDLCAGVTGSDARLKLCEFSKRVQKKIFAGYCVFVKVAYNIMYEKKL